MFCERKHLVVDMLSKGNILCRKMFCGRKRCDENALWQEMFVRKQFVGKHFMLETFCKCSVLKSV